MSVNLLAESNFAGMLLVKLLTGEQTRGDIEIRVVSGLTPSYSFARTMLAVKRMPVAVVTDANSPEPEVAFEKKSRIEEALDDAARGVPFHVTVAVPALDVLFFKLPGLMRRLFGDKLDEMVLEVAELSPRRAIHKLAPDEDIEATRFRILREFEDSDIAALREVDFIQDLLGFIERNATSPERVGVSRG